jgi:hypothetical protein
VSRQQGGIYSGIGYTLALLTWATVQLYADALPATTAVVAMQGLLVTQYLLIPVVTPWLAQGSDSRCNAVNIVMLTFIPLPLLLLLARSSAVASKGIWLSQVTAACLAALSYTFAHALLTQLSTHWSRRIAIGTLQILAATLVWAGRHQWLPWLTG